MKNKLAELTKCAAQSTMRRKSPTKPNSQPAPLTTPNRRAFLKGLGALGAASLFYNRSAEADSNPPRTVPIHGIFGTTFKFIPTATPGVLNEQIEGVGDVPTLGVCTIVIEQTTDFRAEPPATIRSDWVLTFADGDALNATAHTTGTPDPTNPAFVKLSATGTITGGTGRFENATGELRALGVGHVDTPPDSFPEGHATFDLEGLLRLSRD